MGMTGDLVEVIGEQRAALRRHRAYIEDLVRLPGGAEYALTQIDAADREHLNLRDLT